MVERSPEEGDVTSSTLVLGTIIKSRIAGFYYCAEEETPACLRARDERLFLIGDGKVPGHVVTNSVLYYMDFTLSVVFLSLFTFGNLIIRSPCFSTASASSGFTSSGNDIILENAPQYNS